MKNHLYDDAGLCFECDDVQPKTSAQRQSDHRERMREKGYKCCNIWVPEDRRDELMAFAKTLCV